MSSTPSPSDLGSANGQDIVDTLQEEVTVGYRPVIPLEGMWAAGTDMPQITLRRDIELMRMHPVVSIALEYYQAGCAGAEFWGGPAPDEDPNAGAGADGMAGMDPNDPNAGMPPDTSKGKPVSEDPRVAQFVLDHVRRFWVQGVPTLQEGGYPYGWAPGEHIYKTVGGALVWSHVKAFHPNDGFILTSHQTAVGIRVKNIRSDPTPDAGTGPDQRRSGGSLDLWFASGAIPAKAAWYAHRPRFNQYYGRSQFIGAWRPWRRLGWRDGFEQVTDAAVYRAGYRGPIVRHPMEDSQTAQSGIPATVTDGRGMPRRAARDVARQMVEWAKAGAGFTIPSTQYPPTQGGGNKWDVEWPEHVMDVRPLIEACKYLEDQIFLGIGVPPELIKAGGVGSGYQGRSIPREAFLEGQQRVANGFLAGFVEQVVRPLVLWNFGDIPFEVYCKSILKSQSDNKQGGQEGGPLDYKKSEAAKKGWEKRKAYTQDQNTGNNPSQPEGALSLNAGMRDKILAIAQGVLQRRAGR